MCKTGQMLSKTRVLIAIKINAMCISHGFNVENMLIKYETFSLTRKPFVATLDNIKHEVL